MSVFLAFILSLDALGIGVSYKVRGISLPFVSKLVICTLSFAATYSAIAFGTAVSGVFNEKTGSYIGSVMLILTGLWIIITSTGKNKTNFNKIINIGDITITIVREPEKCDFDNSNKLETKEALYMGIVLSIDSFCSGIGLGFIQTPALIISVLIGIFQFLLLYIGEFTGNILINKKIISEKTCVVLSGLVLIIIALLKLF